LSAFVTVEALLAAGFDALPDGTMIPDGVYIGLPERIYFGQDALGSSDLIRLWKYRHGWWWASRHNPDFVDRDSRERILGSAVHAIILEGVDAYESRFCVLPDRPPGAIDTIDEIKAALAERRFSLRGTSGWSKDDWLTAAAANLPEVPCWSNMIADAYADAGGRPMLTAIENRMLRIMYGAALANPRIRVLMEQDGEFPPLAEISVLKTDPTGVRRRWRFDRLFPQFTVDLKTLGNWDGRPLKFSVGDHIARNGYDIQRADYDVGRGALYDLVRDGFQVYGGTLEQRDWLRRMVEMGGKWDWVWLFFQKPDSVHGRAPVLFPVYDDNESDLKRYGRAKVAKAAAFYREAVAEFGLDRPWTSIEELHHTAPDLPTSISIPHWIAEDEPPEDASAYDAAGGEN
jgi:hypothetical protein